MEHEPGSLISGKYRIVRLLGDGGMGSVYEATHEVLGTSVALKFLFPHLARIPGLTERVLREARVSATIRSPHVTQVTDVDQLPNGVPFLVMELLKGESLQRLLNRVKRLPRDQAIDFGLQVLVGLEAAHALGVVHRDLKPDNAFVTQVSAGPVIKLLDFGIAKVRTSSEYKNLTRPGAVMGTPEYMAPEQAFSADQADTRSDIYSVGVMLYEMLSGQLPAAGSTPQEIAGNVIAGRITPIEQHHLSLPQGLVNLIHRAIQAKPEERPPSALEMRRALAAFAGELSPAGRAATTFPPADKHTPPPMTNQGTQKVPTMELSSAGSALPRTLPPEQPLAPARADAPGLPKTASMPEVAPDPAWPANAANGAVMATAPLEAVMPVPAAPRRARRSRLALWLTSFVLLAGGASAGVWFVIEQQSDLGPPPPQPREPGAAPPTVISAQTEGETYNPAPTRGQAATPTTPRAPAQTARPAPPVRGQKPAASGVDAGAPLLIPLPQIQLPPGFPALPSTLPTSLPPIPSGIIPPGLLPTSWPTNLPPLGQLPGYAPASPGEASPGSAPQNSPSQQSPSSK
jgi:serine/threonine protein kinase